MFRFHHFRGIHIKKIAELGIVRLIISIALAAVATVWALHMRYLGFSDSQVGFLTAFFYIVAFITAFISIPILEAKDEVRILFVSLLMCAIGYFLIPMTLNKIVFVLIGSLIVVAAVFRVDSFDILFRDESNSKELNENEGMMYSLISLGWLVGPLVGGYFLLRYGSESVFYLGSFMFFLAIIMLYTIKIKEAPKKRDQIDKNILQNIRDFITNPNATKPFLISSGVYMWWTLILIYSPLFIVNSGLDRSVIAVFFAFIFLPLVMVEYMMGKLSKDYGFKKFFCIGYFLLGLLSLFLFFNADVNIMMLTLILGSVALSFIEPLQDSYFFCKTKKNDEEKFYPIYATSEFFGVVVMSSLVAITLLFLPQNYAFLIVSILMFIMMFVARTVKH